jgi:hypothetical protein
MRLKESKDIITSKYDSNRLLVKGMCNLAYVLEK